MKYLRLVTDKVELIVKSKLPSKFGLILDGWTENSIHFCVLFACIPGTCDRLMLSFSPLLDPKSQDAVSHYDWIVSMLAVYEKGPDNILFFCSDNTNTMPALARLLRCPFLGCNSHRLALYVRQYLDCNEDDESHLINKVKALMKKLRAANKAAALMMETHLKAIVSNATRWSSVYNMIKRYNRIKDVINNQDRDLVPFLMSPVENVELVDIETTLKDINDITIALQGGDVNLGDDVNLDDARIFLDGVIRLNIMKDQRYRINEDGDRVITHYGENDTKYLISGCSIAPDAAFESGIVKILRKQEANLSAAEKNAVRLLLRAQNEPTLSDVDTGNYAWDLQNQAKRARVMESKYIDLRFIPATSVVAERAFSTSGLVYDEWRQAMTPYHLECVLFLKHNHQLWDVQTVAEVYNE